MGKEAYPRTFIGELVYTQQTYELIWDMADGIDRATGNKWSLKDRWQDRLGEEILRRRVNDVCGVESHELNRSLEPEEVEIIDELERTREEKLKLEEKERTQALKKSLYDPERK